MNFWEIFINTFFTEHLRTTASGKTYKIDRKRLQKEGGIAGAFWWTYFLHNIFFKRSPLGDHFWKFLVLTKYLFSTPHKIKFCIKNSLANVNKSVEFYSHILKESLTKTTCFAQNLDMQLCTFTRLRHETSLVTWISYITCKKWIRLKLNRFLSWSTNLLEGNN